MNRRQMLAGAAVAGLALPTLAHAQAPTLAFPGALGWAASTPGGRGGRIIRVTTLAGSGPGSFREAVEAEGPRIVVFEVGGVIDLEKKGIRIRNPFLTIAGQTAPMPGVTFIRGDFSVSAHDVVIRHIRIRSGDAGAAKKSGWEVDGLSTTGAYNVIIDHCTFTWATDENLSTSGPRFDGGDTPEAWRTKTSHRVTLSNNIIAEGLSNSSHSKGEHSKGSLIHDNASEIFIVGNLYASNFERNQLFKGGAFAVSTNNLIYNPGGKAMHYQLNADEWVGHPYVTGKLALVGNALYGGPSTETNFQFLYFGGEGDLDLYMRDNIAIDRMGREIPPIGNFAKPPVKITFLDQPPFWPEGYVAKAAKDVEAAVLAEAGARRWDKDPTDDRFIREVKDRTGRIIDSQDEVGGYPKLAPTRAAFDEKAWNLATMERR